MSEDFLSRWSRRKRGADELPPSGEESEPLPPSGTAEEPEEDVITPEELAALPAVEEISATTDLVGFLRKGVPAALRNAALRKAWVLDPAIRDYVGDARDYAWDWNTPGGVPCTGPLSEGTDVAGMVRRILGESRLEPEHGVATADVHGNVKLGETPPEAAFAATAEPQKPVPDSARPADLEMDADDALRPKKHGGALPG